VTLRAGWVTLRARWVTLRARLGDAESSLGDVEAADFQYLGKPPWVFSSQVSLQQLRLHELVPVEPPVRATRPLCWQRRGAERERLCACRQPTELVQHHAQAEAAEAQAEAEALAVTVDMEVTPAGSGFFVRGGVVARVARSCDCCGAPITQRVQGPLELWLTATECAFSEDAEAEVYWPESRNTVDLTRSVRDVVALAVPTMARCHRAECRPDGARRCEEPQPARMLGHPARESSCARAAPNASAHLSITQRALSVTQRAYRRLTGGLHTRERRDAGGRWGWTRRRTERQPPLSLERSLKDQRWWLVLGHASIISLFLERQPLLSLDRSLITLSHTRLSPHAIVHCRRIGHLWSLRPPPGCSTLSAGSSAFFH
jgi:uncharacterized metal-binding protein YceD (DUF177 family)